MSPMGWFFAALGSAFFGWSAYWFFETGALLYAACLPLNAFTVWLGLGMRT